MSPAVKFVVRSIEPALRPVRLRLPFRFGSNTLTACPQLFVRVDVEVIGHGSARGWAAEMMIPKWFDKRGAHTPADNVADLARSVQLAAQAYAQDAPATAYGLFARHHEALMSAGQAQGLTELSAGYGQAVIDRAVLDALCRACEVSFFTAFKHNLPGLEDAALAADLKGWDWRGWLEGLAPLARIEARHTVGLLDELDTLRYAEDGLPVSLRAVLKRYGHRCFKIKLAGQPESDLERLRSVLEVLDHHVGDYRYTLDGNEQYADRAALAELMAGLRTLRPPLYLEQPVPRETSLEADLAALPTGAAPLLMDEADGRIDSFAQARDCGWTGVSSKGCKGLYRALLNRARCDQWNAAEAAPRYFMSAEDLTCQAGVSLQQDLALAALLGLTHSERNGHHYVDGFGTAPEREQQAWARAHPDLYSHDGKATRLRIEHGMFALGSLHGIGYAHGPDPDPRAFQPLEASAGML